MPVHASMAEPTMRPAAKLHVADCAYTEPCPVQKSDVRQLLV